ncbi:MAG: hypothetical protein IT305_04410 [Chloroflexi bacterium]|nr:hypothetical protein [Chloroflexota bacterium]
MSVRSFTSDDLTAASRRAGSTVAARKSTRLSRAARLRRIAALAALIVVTAGAQPALATSGSAGGQRFQPPDALAAAPAPAPFVWAHSTSPSESTPVRVEAGADLGLLPDGTASDAVRLAPDAQPTLPPPDTRPINPDDPATVRPIPPDQQTETGPLPPPISPSAAVPRRIVVPSEEYGLSRERPIPFGWTCSCTIDRVGLTSQFDITMLRVDPDAYTLLREESRFNRPPAFDRRWLGVYVGLQYIAGPQDVAYHVSGNDFVVVDSTQLVHDLGALLRLGPDYQPNADVFPGNFVNGWVFFQTFEDKPAVIGWRYSFVGQRAIWFALR